MEVATVDSFQGKEAQAVILSFVRSNASNQVGFLREHRRLNVGISRAKDYLFMVLDVATMARCGIPNINRLLAIMEEEEVTVRKPIMDAEWNVDDNGEVTKLSEWE